MAAHASVSEETPQAGPAQSEESEETPQPGPGQSEETPQPGPAGTGQLKTNKRTRFHLVTGQWIT